MRQIKRSIESKIVVIVHLHLAFLALFRCHEDDSERSAGAVD